MSAPHEPWAKHRPLVGRRIIEVTTMTKAESDYWGVQAIVLQLDDGSRWWLSRDSEGNDGGDIHPMNNEDFTSSMVRI